MSRHSRTAGAASFVALALGIVLVTPAHAAGVRTKNGVLKSFDGTPIAYTLFVPRAATARRPVPIIFNTHGWSGHRTRDAEGIVKTLLDAGYAVLTWDARGFGDSGGEAEVDSQDFEVKDVRALIGFVAGRKEIQRDAPGDPRMGMVGGSYAGGIQLMTAAADTRIDAIVPQIAWNDLVRSLKPGGVLKLGWDSILYAAGVATGTAEGLDSPAGPQTGSVAQMVHRALIEGVATNDWSAEVRQWFTARSPKLYIRPVRSGGIRIASVSVRPVPGIHAPALIIQGVNDTLFPINEGIANMRAIAANGVDTKLIVFCGSLDGGAEPAHSVNLMGTSCASGGEAQGDHVRAAILAWFDRYVKDPLGDAATGPRIEFQTQDGAFHAAGELPRTVVGARGSGSMAHLVVPTSGVVTAPQPSPDGVRVPIKARAGWTLFGVPRAEVEVTGSGPEVDLFFKLLDIAPDGRATVIDDQVMPAKVTDLSDEPQQLTVSLGGVAWRVQPGHALALEISTSSNDHAAARTPAVANVRVSIEAPVLRALVAPSRAEATGD